MGTHQFQREYIQYLQERNKDLLNKLNHLKENYENKILTTDSNKHYLISALEDVLNVCTKLPQEIDFFFDKMTAAMSAFKNVLLRKSEMVQLVENITKLITPTENIRSDLMSLDSSDVIKEQLMEGRGGRKAGTVKVSPMINGHIISTEPRIYLSRVPGAFAPIRKSDAHQLSPIIEASPDTSSDQSLHKENSAFREIKIPLERINLSKMSYNYMSEESPKSRFKGPKTWKKSLSSNKPQSDRQKNSVISENGENVKNKFSVGEVDLSNLPEDIDPLEGPSWLFQDIHEMNPSSSCFMDYKRRKHRFATVFDKDEGCVTYFEKMRKSLNDHSNELYDSQEDNDAAENETDSKRRSEQVSDGSVDFISESPRGNCKDSVSPEKKWYQRRKHTAESFNKSDIIDVKDIKKESSSFGSKTEKKIRVCQTGSSDEEINEENSVRKSRENRKRSLKLLSLKSPVEKRTQISKKNKNEVEKDASSPISVRNDVKSKYLEPDEEFTPKKAKTRLENYKKKSVKSPSKIEDESPVDVLSENAARRRRKAAPNFKLVEPNLKGKLRRN